MPPRVAYWTSAFEPDIEAVASEVALLRRSFPGSITWGVHSRRWLRLAPRQGFGFPSCLHWLFRGTTCLAQSAFEIQHLFGALGDWFHLKALRQRPAVMTLTLKTEVCDRALLEKIDRFVIEWPAARDELLRLGIDSERIELIHPPVDLDRFRSAPEPSRPFTALFASSPDRADWLEGRGVPLILDAARLRPAMRFRLVWRPWGNSLAVVQQWIAERGLDNVELVVGRFAAMPEHYRSAHAVLVPFLKLEQCKPAPNSLVEGLACGRPAVMTEGIGLAELVTHANAGVVCESTAESLADCLDRLQADWPTYSTAARRTAAANFAAATFINQYRRLYHALLESGR